MIRKLLNLLFLTILSNCLYAQDSVDFKLTPSATKLPASKYGIIKYIDSRPDTTFFGVIQKGAFNSLKRLKASPSFGAQLSSALNDINSNQPKPGELLLHLRQYNFAEITGAMSEKGYCYFKADMYALQNGQYFKINAVDTVVHVSGVDVTKSLLRNGSNVLTGFIANSLLTEPAGKGYSYNDIVKMDSIEKRDIKLYNTATYTNGLYTTFKSFINQTPDNTIVVDDKNGKINSVKITGENGKPQKVKTKETYAIVHNGKPFIATKYGYYPLEKINDDFVFTGKAVVTANTGDVIAASFFFGIAGGLLASNNAATFEMKLDHTNGGFIRLREVKEPVTAQSRNW